MASNTLALIRRRRVTRPTHKRVPVQARPDNIAREYTRELKDLVNRMHAIVLPWALAQIQTGSRQDADFTDVKLEVYRLVNRRKRGLLAQGIGGKVKKFTDGAVGAQVKAVIGVNPLASISPDGALIKSFVAENVSLIKTVPDRYLDQVKTLVQESVEIGRRADVFAAMMEDRKISAGWNAERIARDQVSKLNAQVTEARHADLGIDAYFWRGSMDERERDAHVALEGQRFTYADPPEVGNPGEDIMCRCRAEPDLSRFFS